MGAMKKLADFSPVSLYYYLKSLRDNFGMPFFLLMTSTYISVKGSMHHFADFAELPYYQAIGQEGVTFQINSAAGHTPWTAKGFIGVISDTFPIFGYQKASYLFIFNILGAIGTLSLAAFPLEVTATYTYLPAFFYFLLKMQSSGYDLLLEGKYVEQMKKRPKTKGSLVTYSWFGTLAGMLPPALFVGPLSDYSDVRWAFVISTFFGVHPLPFIAIGGMIDDNVPKEKNFKLDVDKIRAQWKAMFLASAMGVGGIGTTFIALFTTQIVQVTYGLTVTILIVILTFIYLKPSIAKVNTYKFLSQALYFNINGALDYWYTASSDCVADGPHFNMVFYRSYVQILGIVAQIVGLAIYQVIFMDWNFRFIYWTSTILRMGASIFDLVIVNRWNKAIGLSDSATYIMGNAIIYQVTYMIDYIPSVIINAKLCPKDVESTMFALLASSSNYGGNLSRLLGAYLMTAFDIRTTVESGCNFENLSTLIAVAHLLGPLISVPFVFLLIPNATTNDNLVDSKKVIEEYEQIAKQWEEGNVTQKV